MSTEGEFWGIVLGAAAIVLAILIPFLIERLRRPHLIVTLSPNAVPNRSPRFLHGTVTNNPHRRVRWIDRNPAYDAVVNLTFRRNGQRFLGPINTKWTRAPECITPVVQLVTNQPVGNPPVINIVDVFDSTKTAFSHHMTLPCHDDGQEFDIVVKNDGDNECYAINGWSYRFQNLRDPTLAIPLGIFTVDVEVVANNSRSEIMTFRLANNGNHLADVHLTPL